MGLTERSVLPIPYPDGLVVGARDDPRQLVVEEDGADVVEMAIQGEQTPPGLIGPDLDLVIITARDEEGLGLMKVDTPDRAVVLFEAVY